MVRRVIICAAAGAALCSMPHAAAAAGASVNVDSSCLNGDGVVDITLLHVGKEGLATFRVTDPLTGAITEFDVEPGNGVPVSFGQLPDGPVTVKVLADGTDASYSVDVACDPAGAAFCAPGTSGDTCVASGLPLPQQAPASPAVLPATGGAEGLWIGVALVACGAAASLVSRRRHH